MSSENKELVDNLIIEVQSEIENIKSFLSNLPVFPQGQVPLEISSFHNKINSLNDQLQEFQALKNSGQYEIQLYNPNEQSQTNQNSMLNNSQIAKSTANKGKYNISYKNETIRLPDFGKAYRNSNTNDTPSNNKRPKGSRVPAEITENDLKKGVLDIVERKLVPKDTDLSAMFDMGVPTMTTNKMKLEDKHSRVRNYKIKTEDFQNKIQEGVSFSNEIIRYKSNKNNNSKVRLKMLKHDEQDHSMTTINTKQSDDQNSYIQLQDSKPSERVYKNQPDSRGNKMTTFQDPNDTQEPFKKSYTQPLSQTEEVQRLKFINMRILEDSVFYNFKEANKQRWGNLMFLIRRLERMIQARQRAGVRDDNFTRAEDQLNFLVDCNALESVSSIQSVPNDEALIECIIGSQNQKFVQDAAVKIQAWCRMVLVRRVYLKTKQLIKQADIIKVCQNNWKHQKNTMKKCNDIQKQKYKNWKLIQSKFIKNFKDIKKKPRVEIHIPSLSLSEHQRNTTEMYRFKQSMQMSRIFRCKDPNVKIIQILPFEVSDELINQYYKILEMEGIKKADFKITFIVPNNFDKFHENNSISSILQQSGKSIKNILRLVENKTAQIVPGTVSDIDIKLAVQMNLPIQSCEPNKNSLYSVKSGTKKIFRLSELPTSAHASEIYDQVEFYTSLTKLIASNTNVSKWVFKIDNETRSRGTAMFDSNTIKILQNMRKTNNFDDETIDKLQALLKKNVPKKTVMCCPAIYQDFEAQLSELVKHGGIIEAVPEGIVGQPCFSFDLQPDGDIVDICSQEKIMLYNNICASQIYPQSCLKEIDIASLIGSVAESLMSKDLFGFITLEFVAFADPFEQGQSLFWAIDIDIGLSNIQSHCTFQQFLLKGSYTPTQDRYQLDKVKIQDEHIEETDDSMVQDRTMCYIPQIQSKGLTQIQYKTFFHMCRIENLSFDVEDKMGVVFLLSQSMQAGCLGLSTFAGSKKQAIKQALHALQFINNQSNDSKLDGKDSFYGLERTDKINQRDLISVFQIILKKL